VYENGADVWLSLAGEPPNGGGGEEEEENQPNRLSRGKDFFCQSGEPPRLSPYIDLSRARRRTHDTSRTTRHARHFTHGSGNVNFPVGDTFGITHPTSDIYIYIYIL